MTAVSALYIYPIKALGGIALNMVQVTDRGFQYDRRWMLIDANYRFLSQRELPAMALLQTALEQNSLAVFKRNEPGNGCRIPLLPAPGKRIQADIWGKTCEVQTISEEADAWFSLQLDADCRLVYMPDDSRLAIDEKYYPGGITSLSDGYPVLMLSEASLERLSERAGLAIEMARFRPNLVISGCSAHEEDRMARFMINNIPMRGVKPSARCTVPSIDPATAVKGKEPLHTLSAYRRSGNQVYFGENVVPESTGFVQVGDEVRVVEWKEGWV
jgi:uncharacterized protein YcbX